MPEDNIANEIDDLIAERYGMSTSTPRPAAPIIDSPVLEALLSHRCVRRFSAAPLAPGALELLIAAAQSAATSSNLQTWSVVSIEDPDREAEAATICGDQDFIRKAPLFLVFCADLSRLTFASNLKDLPGIGLEYLEMFLMAAIDASLAAQNVAIAAESMGLGICYVGAARNRPRDLAKLLNFPPRVFATFGMAVGLPDPEAKSVVKPRLPQREVLMRETYSVDERAESVAEYDRIASAFYGAQSMNVSGGWSLHSAKRVATVEALNGRHLLREILADFGFDLK